MKTDFNSEKLKRTVRYNVTLPYLHPAQKEVAKSKKRFRVLVAGRRFGKTRLGTLLCLAKAMEGKNAWWVAPTYSMAIFFETTVFSI